MADDGEVRRLFAKSEAAFVWRPEKASYAEIEDLYRALGAKFLSESLSIACLNGAGRRLSQPKFLTNAAKSLIWAWAVNTLDKEQYERIHETGILTAITGTTEEAVQNLKILFTLDRFVAVGKRLAYWDVRNRRLLVEDDETDREVVRQEIAETVARGIMLNRPYREVESFVFQMLCADTSRARSYISRRDWSLPAEGKSLLEGRTSEPIPESEIEQPDENNPASNEVREDGAADDEGARHTPQDKDPGGDDGDEHTGEHDRASHLAGAGQAGTGMHGGSGGAGHGAPGGQHKGDSAPNGSGRAHSSDAGQSATSSEKGVPPFISYVGTTHKDQESDSDGADAAHRRELEEKAIRFILDREKDLVPTPYGNPGFDLYERDGNDQPRRWVEVKAISGVWKGREVALTRPEYECAREHKGDFWLYVVENAADPEQRKVIRIQDPAGKARNFKFDHGWADVADQD